MQQKTGRVWNLDRIVGTYRAGIGKAEQKTGSCFISLCVKLILTQDYFSALTETEDIGKTLFYMYVLL